MKDKKISFTYPEGFEEAAALLECFPQLPNKEAREGFIPSFISTITIF